MLLVCFVLNAQARFVSVDCLATYYIIPFGGKIVFIISGTHHISPNQLITVLEFPAKMLSKKK